MPTIKPAIIGLYGVPGCGKTYLLTKLKEILGEDKFGFCEGSVVIHRLVPGGLDKFHTFDNEEKELWRKRAIEKIRKEAVRSGKTAIVTGHFMFWSEDEEQHPVYTKADLETYTHILYLNVDPEVVAQRRADDKTRDRPKDSIKHLREWQEYEKSQLRQLSQQHSILFLSLSSHRIDLSVIPELIRDLAWHDEKFNSATVDFKVDEIMAGMDGPTETMLVLDADRTLTAEDTGKLFWEVYGRGSGQLDAIFKSPLQYSYVAFRQAVMLYEEMCDDEEFDCCCRDVAAQTELYPEFASLLRVARSQHHVGAVVVTSGLRCVWEKVLHREGLSHKVKVIGGGRISDIYVVNPSVKEAVVDRLQTVHKTYVWAFGDSPLDIEMLKKANQAIVVVGKDGQRSKSMDKVLEEALTDDHFRARQAILPSTAAPRLDVNRLPVVSLTQREFVADVFARGRPKQGIEIIDATERTAANLLMTAMRDARNGGPILCEAHRRVGSYLATEFVTSVIGLEKYPVPHVQGNYTDGYRLLYENRTMIVPLMRGGDPMARGVWDVFPSAMYLHAKDPADIKNEHLEGKVNLILVDSVVNTGKSIAEFVQHIRNLHATICIVVVAGVVQADCASGGPLSQALAGGNDTLNIVTLRVSQNKYTGSKGTDTGNRLFNSTHLA